MDPARFLLMGRVGRPHGVRGEVKVFAETDDPTRFRALDRVYLGPAPESAAPREIKSVRFQALRGETVVLISFEGIDAREAVADLSGLRVYADRADLPPLADGEAFIHDLIGLTVWRVDEAGEPEGEPLGTVRDIYEGPQLLFAIAREDAPEVLLPDVDAFVAAVDVPGGRLLVRPPDGLFD